MFLNCTTSTSRWLHLPERAFEQVISFSDADSYASFGKTCKTAKQVASFTFLLMHHFSEIVFDNHERNWCVRQYDRHAIAQKGGSAQILERGVWYGEEYYHALKKWDKPNRLKAFVERGTFFHGYAPSVFEPVSDQNFPTGRRLCAFRIKPEITPSRALTEMRASFSFLECDSARFLAVAYAIQTLISSRAFDQLFSRALLFPLTLGSIDNNPLARVFAQVEIWEEADIRIGDFCYFSNTLKYSLKHIAGHARGFNVICCGKDASGVKKYLGLGLDPRGVTRVEIERELWKAYNETPLEEGMLSSQIWQSIYTSIGNEEENRKMVQSLRENQISWEEFQERPSGLSDRRRMDGKLELRVLRPADEQSWRRLMRASPEGIGTVFIQLMVEQDS